MIKVIKYRKVTVELIKQNYYERFYTTFFFQFNQELNHYKSMHKMLKC